MHKLIIKIILIGLMTSLSHGAAAEGPGAFQTVKAKYFSKDKFVFPDDLSGGKLTVIFLAMSDSQENGEAQQNALLAWHEELENRGVFSEDVVPYHFPVLENPPFFVKGIIAGAMSESYEGKVPLNQAGVLYVKDLDAFASAANLPNDGLPTIVIASAQAMPLQYFKGDLTPEAADQVAKAIAEQLTPPAQQ